MSDISKSEHKVYKIKFNLPKESRRFEKESFKFAEVNHEKNRVRVMIDDKDINRLIKVLGSYNIRYISEVKRTLEEYLCISMRTDR